MNVPLDEKTLVTREEFVNEMKKHLNKPDYRGWDLGGLLAGITMKAQRGWGRESLYEIEWKYDSNQEGYVCYYKLSSKYASMIKRALEQVKVA
jgi:hypothetical protein